MLIFCDVDNTLVSLFGEGNYELIKKVNDLYDRGNFIILLTNRPSIEFTVKQIKNIGLKFHGIVYNRDSSFNFKQIFINNLSDDKIAFIDNDMNVLEYAKHKGYETISI